MEILKILEFIMMTTIIICALWIYITYIVLIWATRGIHWNE